jgi:predicted amidohydrolase
MRDILIATAQFEHADGDKAANLRKIGLLTRRAAAAGAEMVVFHECSITGYTFLQSLTRDQLELLAEPVPDGPSSQHILALARAVNIPIAAGLIERDPAGQLRKCYFVAGPSGLLAKHHKLHPFIHPALVPGDRYTVFEYAGVRFGVLICYDCNLPENVRATTLLGAEVLLAPHVTGGTPSAAPGRGLIPRALWDNREADPVRLRMECEGPKGRAWLLKWLPARAWENGLFIVFANAIGLDFDTIKPGRAMILDPHGEILAESHALGDDVVLARCTRQAFDQASGRRYLRARRPELYSPLVAPPALPPETRPGWRLAHQPADS